MGDDDKISTRYNYQFIHNVLADFYKDMLDYFADYLYPRFGAWRVVGTYTKAIEYLLKQIQYDREIDMPMIPAIILNPSGDFVMDETYGMMMWRYPNLMPGFMTRIFEPIYQDENVKINVGFSRLKGEVEFLTLYDSYYEYADTRIFLNLIFGGLNRYIYPRYFNSFIILPSEIYDYEYKNPVTGQDYTIHIPHTYNKLVKTTNKDEVVYPCTILPRFKMTNMSDASTKFGGIDRLPDWRLTFSVEYEIEIPTFLVLQTDYLVEKINLDIKYGSCYSANNIYGSLEVPPDEMMSFSGNLDYVFDSTEGTLIETPTEATLSDKKTRRFKTRYYHIVTQEEEDSTTDVDIVLPETITDNMLLLLYGKYGPFAYGDHYTINTAGTILTIHVQYVQLVKGDIIELYVYEYI